MAFVDNVPKHIEELEKKIKKLEREKADIDWGHECDCEYCDRQNETSDEAEAESKAIEKKIKEHETMIERLKGYSKMWQKS